MSQYVLQGSTGVLVISAIDLARLRLIVGDTVPVALLHTKLNGLPNQSLRVSLEQFCLREHPGAIVQVLRHRATGHATEH